MPTPFTHLEIAQRLLCDAQLAFDIRRALKNAASAYLLGSTSVNGGVAPASYISPINRDLPSILTTALDSLLVARFGSGVNVHTLTITNDAQP